MKEEIISKLQEILNKIGWPKKEEESDVKLEFDTLAPVIMDKQDYEEYRIFFKHVMKEPFVCNVAITGEYGSGKSSVIETFLSKLKKKYRKRCLRVSLRNFEADDEQKGIVALEKKLLNQIICQLDVNTISGSGIYTKQHLRDGIKQTMSCLFLLLMICGVYFGAIPHLAIFESFRATELYGGLFEGNTAIYIFFLMMAGIVFFLFRMINQLPSGWFPDKIACAYKETELSIERDCTGIENALMDTYMDEIVYLLKKQKIQLMIIEDLDRYDSVRIFEQLREINFLLNVNQKKKVKFFYLVKDSMFGNNGLNRTKFFDLILPVAPCIGKGNVWQTLNRLCPDLKHLSDTEKGMFDGLCSDHLDDYRLIKNIANEFNVIYSRHKRIGKDIFEIKKILGMLIYKNVFPQDYAMLKNKAGYVYGILVYGAYVNGLKEGEQKERFLKMDFHQFCNDIFKKTSEDEDYTVTIGRMPISKDYWKQIHRHREFFMLEELVKYQLIEKKDYLQYLSIISAQDVEEILFRSYRYAIKTGHDDDELRFDTEISRDMWDRISKSLTDEQYSSEALANRDIIGYMLDAVKDGAYVWWERTAKVAKNCSKEEKLLIYHLLKDENEKRENWAVLAWDVNLFDWHNDRIVSEWKVSVFHFVEDALYGAVRYDKMVELYENKLVEYQHEYEQGTDKQMLVKDEAFLQYIETQFYTLMNHIKGNFDAVIVLLRLVSCTNITYKMKDVLPYMGHEKLRELIWQKQLFEPNEEDLKTFIMKSNLEKITLNAVKAMNVNVYNKWMGKANIEQFVESLYIPFMLKKAKDNKEILQILERPHLSEAMKKQIIMGMPEKAGFMDVTELPPKIRVLVNKQKKLGCSAKNMLFLIRENQHDFTKEVIQYAERCYKCAMKKDNSYLPGLKKPLSKGEQEQIWQALEWSVKKLDLLGWIATELGVEIPKQEAV